jgi:hypothetical protein
VRPCTNFSEVAQAAAAAARGAATTAAGGSGGCGVLWADGGVARPSCRQGGDAEGYVRNSCISFTIDEKKYRASV